jgi:hypothetical protein
MKKLSEDEKKLLDEILDENPEIDNHIERINENKFNKSTTLKERYLFVDKDTVYDFKYFENFNINTSTKMDLVKFMQSKSLKIAPGKYFFSSSITFSELKKILKFTTIK